MDTPKPEQKESQRAEDARSAGVRGDQSSAALPSSKKTSSRKSKNNVRKLRTERMMSKAELARRAGLSTLTIDRVEKGMPCRMDTKRKILEALGLTPSDRVAVFGDDE
ncbi:MAG: helix-turn-helix transcriptional regulator [Deltaproteobacteria bacterium]|nr:helix-turn-helix transcriptional regulator [Deltaproteobacteria bacterium]